MPYHYWSACNAWIFLKRTQMSDFQLKQRHNFALIPSLLHQLQHSLYPGQLRYLQLLSEIYQIYLLEGYF